MCLSIHKTKLTVPNTVDPRVLALLVRKNFTLVNGHFTTPSFFFLIRTLNFSPRLDVLIFSAISASDVLIDVLNYLTTKKRYSYSTTVYLILNTTVFSFRIKCNRILCWPRRILTQIQKKKRFHPKLRLGMFLSMFLFFLGFQPGCSSV